MLWPKSGKSGTPVFHCLRAGSFCWRTGCEFPISCADDFYKHLGTHHRWRATHYPGTADRCRARRQFLKKME